MSPRKTRPQKQPEQGTVKKASFADLGKTEQDVLIQLAQQRSVTLVTLAADLWRTAPEWNAFDPYPLLRFVIDSLCAHGLVRFTLVHPYGERNREEPTNIRLTPEGWSMMGYPNKVIEVGSMLRHQGPHTPDQTNYRNHPFHAPGGAIEVDTFAEHQFFFPQHIHMYGDNQVVATAEETGDMSRPYTRVTPEMEANIIAARERLGMTSYTDIAERTGLPERTVKYVLVDLPRLRRINAGEKKVEGSLKQRILWAVEGLGEVKDISELRRILGMADSEHDVMHVLHSLHTQGKLDFTERGNGMGTATVVNIRLHKKGKRNGVAPTAPDFVQERIPEQVQPLPVISRTEEEQAISARQHAIEPEATAPQASAPGLDESAAYPLLTELLERERKRQDGDPKALAYVSAAEAIKDVDRATYDTLMAKAAAFDVPYPSPLEREYLSYAEKHVVPDAPGGRGEGGD